MPLAALRSEWEVAGLDAALLPDPPAPATAMHRAVHEQKAGRRLVRPVKGGYAVIDERETATGELEYSESLRVTVDRVGRLTATPEESPAALEVHIAFEKYIDQLTPADSGSWLARMVDKVGAVALRPTGGIYFVPSHSTAMWERIVACVREVSAHRVFAVPALKSSEAVVAISDAMAEEAETACNKLAEELSAGIGKRAMETRITRLNDLEAKVAAYEQLLGAKQATVTERIEALRANLAAAMLLADMGDAE
jgi:hypothetical protein